MPDAVPTPAPDDVLPVDYRLDRSFVARLVGIGFLAAAAVALVLTVLVAALDWPVWVLLAAVVVLALAVAGGGWYLRSRAYVLRCGRDGYRVRLVRGAGVTRARWTDVQEAVAAKPRGVPCVVLRLRDGRSTTIPVQALDVDREQFAREIQRHLRRGQGLRPLT